MGLLLMVPVGKIRTSGLKLQGSRFRLYMRKDFLTVRAVWYGNLVLGSCGISVIRGFQAEAGCPSAGIL